MTMELYKKCDAKEEFRTLSFNQVLLHESNTRMYQVIFKHY